MRFTMYKNSVLATICSMFGAVCIVMAVTGLIGKEIDFLSAIGVIAAGLGLMWLGSVISERKEKRKQDKAAAQQGSNAAKPQNVQISCSRCGHVNLPDSRFCASCGSPVSKPTQITCPHCRHSNSPDSKFCANCGRPISG